MMVEMYKAAAAVILLFCLAVILSSCAPNHSDYWNSLSQAIPVNR